MVRASEPSIQPPDHTPNPPSRLPLPRGDASTDDGHFLTFPPNRPIPHPADDVRAREAREDDDVPPRRAHGDGARAQG